MTAATMAATRVSFMPQILPPILTVVGRRTASLDDRNAHVTIAEPFHDERVTGIPHRSVVDVLARAVVDHFERILVDLERDRQPAAPGESSADPTHVAEWNDLLLAGTQQPAPRFVTRVAGAAEIPCEKEVPAIGHQLVETD